MTAAELTEIEAGNHWLCRLADGRLDPLAKFIDALDMNECDAELIAEAGTVHHETGLTPREILAQRDELAALCDAILKRLDMEHAEMTANGIGSPAFVNAAMRDDLRAALANTQPEGRKG